jgi:hypothetical protein
MPTYSTLIPSFLQLSPCLSVLMRIHFQPYFFSWFLSFRFINSLNSPISFYNSLLNIAFKSLNKERIFYLSSFLPGIFLLYFSIRIDNLLFSFLHSKLNSLKNLLHKRESFCFQFVLFLLSLSSCK